MSSSEKQLFPSSAHLSIVLFVFFLLSGANCFSILEALTGHIICRYFLCRLSLYFFFFFVVSFAVKKLIFD